MQFALRQKLEDESARRRLAASPAEQLLLYLPVKQLPRPVFAGLRNWLCNRTRAVLSSSLLLQLAKGSIGLLQLSGNLRALRA